MSNSSSQAAGSVGADLARELIRCSKGCGLQWRFQTEDRDDG
jgi:hypothetical protein